MDYTSLWITQIHGLHNSMNYKIFAVPAILYITQSQGLHRVMDYTKSWITQSYILHIVMDYT